MPIFEYECGACGARVERLVRNAGDVPKVCTACGSRKLRKALSGFSVSVAAARPAHEPSAACGSCQSSGSCPYGG